MSKAELTEIGASHDQLTEEPVVEVGVRWTCTIFAKTHRMYNVHRAGNYLKLPTSRLGLVTWKIY